MKNALTIDVEFWHSNELLTDYLPDLLEDQMEESLAPILELLNEHRTRATFFVLGLVAEKYPELVRTIHRMGHEIACHAYSHRPLHELGERGLDEEISRSVKLLESISGEKPLGFRAPSFSVDNSTKWAFGILKKHGFRYDSSIFPVRTPLYGIPGAPVEPYRPSADDVGKHDPRGEIIEFPMAVLRAVSNIPVAGGFYLRLLPPWFLRLAVERINRTRAAVIYIHPWETYRQTPRLKGLPLWPRFVTYWGVESAFKKFASLLRQFQFQPLREFLDEV